MEPRLVVANQTLGGRELMRLIRTRVGAGTRSFFVLVPLTPADLHEPAWTLPMDPGLDSPVVDPDSAQGMVAVDRAHEAAERRLWTVLDRIRATGARADGDLGDPDPLVAVEAVLPVVEPVEIILSTLPASISRWVGMDLPSQLRRRTDIPVTVVEAVEGEPHARPAGRRR